MEINKEKDITYNELFEDQSMRKIVNILLSEVTLSDNSGT